MQGRERPKAPRQDMPGAQQEVLVIEKPDAIKLLFSEKHNRILKLITTDEQSISDIARSLKINPGSAHYHLKDLEKHGLVRQVRQEIKGGIVKKYYQAVAKHICLESPDFNEAGLRGVNPVEDFTEKLMSSVELLGYSVSEENRAEAKEVLTRYERRMRELLNDMHSRDMPFAGEDGMVFRFASQFIINMRATDDLELCRIRGQFEKLFLQVQ